METDARWLSLLVIGLCAVTSMAYQRPDPRTAQFATATTAFSVDLMKAVFKRLPGNAIMSPLSVSTVLAMLQQGARNNSAVQLEQVLHLSKDASLTGYQTLVPSLKKRQTKSDLAFGNAMFVNQDFDIVPQYKQDIQRSFLAQVEPINFREKARAANTINQWVNDATRGRIPQLVTPDAISGRTEMILVNAVYFKGQWLKTFETNKTQKLPFHKNGNEEVLVDMMSFETRLRADQDDKVLKAKWVELLYAGLEYSMVLVLPTDGGSLDSLIERLTPQDMSAMVNTRGIKEVTLHLPKFKLNTALSLVSTLKSLSLTSVFDQNSNLEGISTTKAPLIVSDVFHKAEIEVNEQGTEASAASTIYVNTLSLKPDYDDMDFNANQPFLAIVVDKASLLPLFVAKVADPSSE